MTHWKCTEANISEDGTLVTLAFQKAHHIESMKMTLSAEEWHNIIFYRAASKTKERDMAKMAKQLGAAILDLNRQQWERRDE